MPKENADKVECPRCHKMTTRDPKKYTHCFTCSAAINADNSLRRYLVGQALAGLCANHGANAEGVTDRQLARAAVQIADETLQRIRAKECTS